MRESTSDITEGPARPAKRGITRILRALLLAAVLLLIVGGVIIHWAWPAYIRQQIRRELGTYWAGPIDIGDVALSLRGPLIAKDIVLRGPDGAAWVTIPVMEAKLANWPGLTPGILELTLPAPRIQADLSQSLPIRLPSDKGKGKDRPNPLQQVMVTGATITVTQADGATFVMRDLAFDLTKLNDQWHDTWDYSLKGTAQEDEFVAAGRLDVRLVVNNQEVSTLSTTLDLARGKLTGSLQLTNDISTPNDRVLVCDVLWNPAQGQRLSIASRSECHQPTPKQHNIHTDATIRAGKEMDQTLTADLAINLNENSDTPITLYIATGATNGKLLDGEAAAELDLVFNRDFRPSWRCRGFVNDISVRRMEPYLDIDPRYSTGRLNYATWDLRGREPELATVTGGLYVRMSDITFVPGSVLFDLLSAITSEFPLLDTADLIVAAGIDEQVLTFETAQVGGEVLSIAADPGGTARLETHELDMLVSVVMMNELNGLVEQVPVLGPLTDLSKHLTRTHVTGPWENPTLTPVPVEGMGESVLELLEDVLGDPAPPSIPLPKGMN